MLSKKGMENAKMIREKGIDAYNKGKSPISKALEKGKGEKKEKLSPKRFANGKHWTTDDIPF